MLEHLIISIGCRAEAAQAALKQQMEEHVAEVGSSVSADPLQTDFSFMGLLALAEY